MTSKNAHLPFHELPREGYKVVNDYAPIRSQTWPIDEAL